MNTLASDHPTENVLRYALKSSRAVLVFSKHWGAVEDYLLLSYRKNPSILPIVVEIIVNRHRKKTDIDLGKMAAFINSNLRRLSETEKHGELSWLLYLASELAITIVNSNIENLFRLSCPAAALHVCHLHELGLIKKAIDRKNWNTSLDSAGLTSEMWLYAYEATLKGWTGSTKKLLMADAFKALADNQVSFYNVSAHVPDIAQSAKTDISLSLKLKMANAGGEIFDFDGPDDEFDFEEDIDFEEY